MKGLEVNIETLVLDEETKQQFLAKVTLTLDELNKQLRSQGYQIVKVKK